MLIGPGSYGPRLCHPAVPLNLNSGLSKSSMKELLILLHLPSW